MPTGDLEEIERLIGRLEKREPVAHECREVITRVGNARDPSALPALRRALQGAVAYEQWAETFSRFTSSEFKKKAPGGWVVDMWPNFARTLQADLRSTIEKCTPEGEAVVYELRPKRWWRFWS